MLIPNLTLCSFMLRIYNVRFIILTEYPYIPFSNWKWELKTLVIDTYYFISLCLNDRFTFLCLFLIGCWFFGLCFSMTFLLLKTLVFFMQLCALVAYCLTNLWCNLSQVITLWSCISELFVCHLSFFNAIETEPRNFVFECLIWFSLNSSEKSASSSTLICVMVFCLFYLHNQCLFSFCILSYVFKTFN